MATQQQPPHPRPRIPFAASVANRDEMPTVDARLINGFLEKGEDKTLYAYRRPGTKVNYSVGAAPGRGIYNWEGDIYSVFGTDFYKNATRVATVVDDGTIYTFSSNLGATPHLFFHNTLAGYTYDPIGGVVLIPSGTAATVMGDLSSGNNHIKNITPNTTGIAVSDLVSGLGIPSGVTVVSVDSSTQITMSANATANYIQNTVSILTPGQTAFPPLLVPGQAFLDGTTYVMDPKAHIFGSEINDTKSWDPENYLTAQIEPDGGVALAKQLVYVIAFKQWSTEFFYDAAQPSGSPLGDVQGNKINQGCRDAGSVADSEGALIWVTTTRQGNVGVWIIDAARGSSIGSGSVERLLQDASYVGCCSYALHTGGHRFYVLNVPAANLTLIFDLATNEWYRWTDTNGNYLPYVAATFGANQIVLLQHATNGSVYQMSTNFHDDSGSVIPWDLYTPNYDAGQRINKELARMDFIGDQTPGCWIITTHSEDDYKTWSAPRMTDMGQQRPNLKDCGSFRRRAWHFSNRTKTFLRIQAVELDIKAGTA